MFNIFKRNKTNKTKPHILKNLGSPRYKVLDSGMTEMTSIETKDEDGILTKRNSLIAMSRNAFRNSPTLMGILTSFEINVCGNKAGKTIFNFENNKDSETLFKEFSKWTRQASYFDSSESLNLILKLILKTYILGGDCLILQSSIVDPKTNKLIIFEPDEIANSTDEALVRHYGKNAKQINGRVYVGGRFVGVICSKSARGLDTFPEDKCYFLHIDPDKSILDSPFLMPRSIFRPSQGRGISMMTSSLQTLLQLEDLCMSELQASKLNSKLIGQILQNGNQETHEADVPSVFDKDTDFDSMSEDEINQLVNDSEETETISMQALRNNNAEWISLPPGFSFSSIDTKHPNTNLEAFLNFQISRICSSFHVGQSYATMRPDGNFKMEQIMSEGTWVSCQKFLEGICDWILFQFAKNLDAQGIINIENLGDEWMKNVSWSWPKQIDQDEKALAESNELKLKTFQSSYLDIYGPEWKSKLTQIKNEIAWMKENSIPHVAYEMVSGGERTGADDLTTNETIEA